MDGPIRQHLDCLHFQKLWHACSFKRCCLFLVIFLLFLVLTLGVATILVIFLLKPQKPVFAFQTISLDWYNLDTYSDSFLFVSSVITLTLNAQNPNKFGLRYSSTRLGLYYEGLPIGVIRVPGFIQPAHSNNVSVPTRVLFDCVNISQIVDGASLHDGSRKDMIQMNILGDVRAQLSVHHMAFLKIKIALDCDINVDYREFITIKNEVNITRVVNDQFASFPNISEFISMKCALSFYA
ncbi:hypothetical protein ACB092_05G007000 [Castanea dentata]